MSIATDWKRYEINLPVAADATNINFGALLTGNGTAWFDGFLVVELAHRLNTVVTRSVEENIRASRVWVEKVFGLAPGQA